MRMELSVGKLEESVPLPTGLEPIELVLGGTSQRLLKKQKTRNNGKNQKKRLYPPLASPLHRNLCGPLLFYLGEQSKLRGTSLDFWVSGSERMQQIPPERREPLWKMDREVHKAIRGRQSVRGRRITIRYLALIRPAETK
jgi:hypothetical protein